MISFSTSGWQLLTLIHVDQHADTLPEHAGMSLTYWLIGRFPSLSIRIGAIAINEMTATITIGQNAMSTAEERRPCIEELVYEPVKV